MEGTSFRACAAVRVRNHALWHKNQIYFYMSAKGRDTTFSVPDAENVAKEVAEKCGAPKAVNVAKKIYLDTVANMVEQSYDSRVCTHKIPGSTCRIECTPNDEQNGVVIQHKGLFFKHNVERYLEASGLIRV